ncbi:hypothetical protein BKN14_04715 [Candidatus Gracilibacteria bacterium HOT-871]|nr:hypothetical protein BKN14_04715 [Candidatus Gracilibacteria bacterium HOT-871]
MNPELKNQLKEDLGNITPEQLKELQQSVQNKIENSKKDLVFDEKEKSELADINQDGNLSITESKIEEHLQKLDDLEKQIDFLLTLVEIKSEATIQEVARNTASRANQTINSMRDDVKSVRNNETIENRDDSKKMQEIKEIGKDFEKNGDVESSKVMTEIANSTQEIEKILSKEYGLKDISNYLEELKNETFLSGKVEKIFKIIDGIKINGEARESDLLGVKLEINDIISKINYTKQKDYKQDGSNEIKDLYNLDVQSNNLTLDKALALLNYTNRNFSDIENRWNTVGDGNLSSIDSKVEILDMQSKLIEKINEFLNQENKENSEVQLRAALISVEGGGYGVKIVKFDKNGKIINKQEKEGEGGFIKNIKNFVKNNESKDWFSKNINNIPNIQKNIEKERKSAKEEVIKGVVETKSKVIENFKNSENIGPTEFQAYLLFEKNLDEASLNKVINYSKKYPVEINRVNPEILTQLVKTEQVKINPESFKKISVDDVNFLKVVDFKELFNRFVKEGAEDNDLIDLFRKINIQVSGDTQIIKKKFGFITENNRFKEIIGRNLEFIEISRAVLGDSKDERINADFEKNLDSIASDHDKLVENQDLVVEYILRNINSPNQEVESKATAFFNVIINVIGVDKFSDNNIKKLLYGPKNMTIIKMIIPFRDNIEKRSNIKVADILKNTSNNIKRNTDYINIIKESWDFKEAEKKYKVSDILDISSNIHTAISGLSMLKDKYGDGKILESGLLTQDEIENLAILVAQNINQVGDFSGKDKQVFDEITSLIQNTAGFTEAKLIKYGLQGKNSEKIKERFDNNKAELTENLKKYGLDEKDVEQIIEIIKKNDSKAEDITKEVSKILKQKLNDGNDLKLVEIQTGVMKEIFKFVENDLNEKIEENKKTLEKSGVTVEIQEEFKKEIDKVKEEFETENKGKKFGDKEKKKLAEEFINKKFKDKSEKEKKEIIESLLTGVSLNDRKEEVTVARNNTKEYINYINSGYKGSFREFAKEKNIPLVDAKGEVINAKEIGMKVSGGKFENGVWSYTGGVKLDTNNWTYINSDGNKVELDFTKEEKDMLKSNPEAGKNIVNFYSSLERVGMTKLWNLRNKIFTSVENSFGMQFDRKDGDFLDEREIKIFLNAILVSLGEKPVSKDLNTEAFLTEIELKNGKSFTGTEEQVNNYGDTNLEARFIDKFYPRGDMLGFKQSLFEKAIKNIT